VLSGPDRFLAIEVKRAVRLHHRDLAALKAFWEDYPEAQRLLLSFHPEPPNALVAERTDVVSGAGLGVIEHVLCTNGRVFYFRPMPFR
jgi:hypothetical protein